MARKSIDILLKARDEASPAFASVLRSGQRLAGFLLAGFGIRAIQGAIGSAIDRIDALSKASQKFDIPIEKLQALGFVADRSGVSTEALYKAVQLMGRNVADAAKGTGEAKDALADLGLSASDLVKLGLDDQLVKISGAFGRAATQADKLRIAADIFGRSGPDLINVLDLGEKGIQQLIDRAKELGLVMTAEQAQKAVDAKDAMTDLNYAVKELSNELVIGLAPSITAAATALADASASLRSWSADARDIAIPTLLDLELRWKKTQLALGDFRGNAAGLRQLRLEIEELENLLNRGWDRQEQEAKKKLANGIKQGFMNGMLAIAASDDRFARRFTGILADMGKDIVKRELNPRGADVENLGFDLGGHKRRFEQEANPAWLDMVGTKIKAQMNLADIMKNGGPQDFKAAGYLVSALQRIRAVERSQTPSDDWFNESRTNKWKAEQLSGIAQAGSGDELRKLDIERTKTELEMMQAIIKRQADTRQDVALANLADALRQFNTNFRPSNFSN